MSKEIFWFRGARFKILEGKRGVREAYNCMADDYDYSKYLYLTRKMEKSEERITSMWIRKLSSPVLDVGCGTGRYTINIARSGQKVVALDISLNMLRITQKKARKYGVLNTIDLILADGEHLPFKDGSFNSLICTLTFNHFENCEEAAREFSRVLKKDGVCIISTLNKFTLEDFKKRNSLPLDKVPFRTEKLPPVLIYEIGHSVNDIKSLFSKYGLKVVDAKGCCYWHLIPPCLIRYYKVIFDRIFNFFKPLLKYAEIHVILMKKLIN